MIQFERTLTKKDFLFLSLKNPKLLRGLIVFVVATLVAALVATGVRSEDGGGLKTIAVFIIIAVAFMALLRVARIVVNIVMCLTMKQFQGVFLPQKYTFDTSGMKIETSSGGVVNSGWDRFSGWQKTSSGYILKLVPSGIIIFKNSLIPEGKVAAFESMLKKYIK